MEVDRHEFVKGMRWQAENASGASLESEEVDEVLAMADEIERLRAAITDAAEAVEYGHDRSKVSAILRQAYTPQ